jgi:homoprotocatechuate degradation regulator HpaR
MRKFDDSLPMALLRAREVTMGFFRPLLLAHGLTEQQWRVIRVLEEYGPLEFNELSRIAWIQPPSLTGMLSRLERNALVRRSRSQADQRRLHVALTPEGRRRFGIVSHDAEKQYGVIERQLGRKRLRSLMTVLHDFERLQPGTDAPVGAGKGLSRPRRRAPLRR